MIKLPKITEASIDLSTICQLHCVECSTSKGITHAGIVGKGQLSFEDFSNFIDTNPEIKRIEMSNWGEIFLNKDIDLILDVSTFDDFTHLIALENGKEKVRQAKDAVAALRKHTSGHVNIQQETEFIKQRREQLQKQTSELNRVKQSIEQLKEIFYNLASTKDFQARGYALEKLLNDLFLLYDLAPKSSFKITGEQIDGAFTFNNDEYLLEAKWRNELTAIDDLDAFSGKLQRKLDNTLGLFISINGFSPDAISAFSSGRKLMFLMDGTDIMAILDERISLPDLLRQKKRAAAHTGNIYLRYQDMISK